MAHFSWQQPAAEIFAYEFLVVVSYGTVQPSCTASGKHTHTHTHTGIICKFRPNFGMKALRNSTHFCGGTFLARSNPIPRRARPIIGEATRIYRIDPGIQSAADESGVGANRVAFHGGDGSFASQSTRNLYRSGWWFIPTGWWNRNIHSRSRISIEKSEW